MTRMTNAEKCRLYRERHLEQEVERCRVRYQKHKVEIEQRKKELRYGHVFVGSLDFSVSRKPVVVSFD